MESKMKVKVVMLATEKSKIYRHDEGFLWCSTTLEYKKTTHASPQHLYFLSNEEIQVGDYYCAIGMRTDKHGINLCDTERLKEICNTMSFTTKKVVATTDTSLNLPLIPQEFIQEYVESNGNIDEVFVEFKIVADDFINGKETEGRGTIWKNELAISKVKDTWNYIIIQSKESWTKDELIKYCKDAFNAGYEFRSNVNSIVTFEKWLAQNL